MSLTTSLVTVSVINIIVTKGTPRYKLEALSRLLTTGVRVEDVDDNRIETAGLTGGNEVTVAIKSATNYKVIGSVMPQQIRTLMSLMMGETLELEVEKGVFKEPFYIYALSSEN